MELRDATPHEIDLVLAGTHALWADGLELDDYQDFIRTLMASDWARAGSGDESNYRFLVMVEGPGARVLSALKLYRFMARLDEEAITVGGIGAVFTPPELRRHGHAAEMIARTHALMTDRGDALSLLYSEIGARYYAGLGYQEIDSHPVKIAVPPEGPPPPAGLKRMHRTGLDDVIRLREKEDASASFRLVRDLPYWKYLLARASYPTLSLGRDRWENRLMVAGTGGYLWSMFGEPGLAHEGSSARILELAEAEPCCAVRGLLDDFFGECRRRGATEVDAWLPPGLRGRDPRLSEPGTRVVTPPPVVPMWMPLDAQTRQDMSLHSGAAALHLTDVF